MRVDSPQDSERRESTQRNGATSIEGKLVYRMSELPKVVSISKTTIYELIDKGEFPRPVQLTGKAVGWLAAEVRDWLTNRPKA